MTLPPDPSVVSSEPSASGEAVQRAAIGDRASTEQATLGLMVLKLCKEKGWTEPQVAALFSRKAIRFVFGAK